MENREEFRVPQGAAAEKSFFDSRIRWIGVALLLSGAGWLVFQVEMPDSDQAIIVYCTPDLLKPLRNCAKEFTLRGGKEIIIISRDAGIIKEHLARTGQGDVMFSCDTALLSEMRKRRIIEAIIDTSLVIPADQRKGAPLSPDLEVKAAILYNSPHPETVRRLLLFLSRPECVSVFEHCIAGGKTGSDI